MSRPVLLSKTTDCLPTDDTVGFPSRINAVWPGPVLKRTRSETQPAASRLKLTAPITLNMTAPEAKRVVFYDV